MVAQFSNARSEYIRVTQGLIKYFVIDVWQYSQYPLYSEYGTVLIMLGLHMVVNNIFHQRYLTCF